jgi:hypothetical protein
MHARRLTKVRGHRGFEVKPVVARRIVVFVRACGVRNRSYRERSSQTLRCSVTLY